jgi:hypothetical protein
LPGISKIGAYTGNGGSLDIDCGFSAGARFVMIKGTSFDSSWLIFDTARGITSAASLDPALQLNSADAELNNADYDPLSPLASGFTDRYDAYYGSTKNININAAEYVYLAIA